MDLLARHHHRVVDEFIESVVDEWAGGMTDAERNLLGVLLRSHVETQLGPGLSAVHGLLLEADADTRGRGFRSGWISSRPLSRCTRSFLGKWPGGWTLKGAT